MLTLLVTIIGLIFSVFMFMAFIGAARPTARRFPSLPACSLPFFCSVRSMDRTADRRKYSFAFKQEAVLRVLQNQEKKKDVARELDLSEAMLSRWVREAQRADERKQQNKRTTWTGGPATTGETSLAQLAAIEKLEDEVKKLRSRADQRTQEAERWKRAAEQT